MGGGGGGGGIAFIMSLQLLINSVNVCVWYTPNIPTTINLVDITNKIFNEKDVWLG